MPDLVNKRDHAVRVTDENGKTVRLRPGQVGSYDGSVADALSNIEGVESASSEDKEAYQAEQSGALDAPSTKTSALDSYGEQRVAGRVALVSVPLNKVIGDNDAPIGPPTGVITTKQAVARLGPAEKLAYADHERLPEEAENEGLSPIERAQAEAKALVEEAHVEALEKAQEEGVESIDLEPVSEGSLSSEGKLQEPQNNSEGEKKPKRSNRGQDKKADRDAPASPPVA